jgi:hypothetical protein
MCIPRLRLLWEPGGVYYSLVFSDIRNILQGCVLELIPETTYILSVVSRN